MILAVLGLPDWFWGVIIFLIIIFLVVGVRGRR